MAHVEGHCPFSWFGLSSQLLVQCNHRRCHRAGVFYFTFCEALTLYRRVLVEMFSISQTARFFITFCSADYWYTELNNGCIKSGESKCTFYLAFCKPLLLEPNCTGRGSCQQDILGTGIQVSLGKAVDNPFIFDGGIFTQFQP